MRQQEDPSIYAPLLSPQRDACGTGFVAKLDGSASHEVLREALFAVSNLAHRGAVDADRKTGDGAGVMFALPQAFFKEEYARLSGEPSGTRRVAVGTFFLPESGTRGYPRAKALVEEELARRGLTAYVWRNVPMNTSVLGAKARSTLPDIEQLILMVDPWTDLHTIERRLYSLRRTLELLATRANLPLYIASMSCRTISYKGLMISPILGDFYTDLTNESFETSFAIFHQRYSTNTLPSWHLAQPFRCVAHNGEINTIGGNRLWASIRGVMRDAPIWRDEDSRGEPLPVLPADGSDSACLDAALELLVLSGRSLPHAMSMLIPSAPRTIEDFGDKLSAFYDYHACINEPWDGPAAVVFGDGDIVGATLDRNGLRPARYKITRDGLVVLSSEVGVLDLPQGRVVERGRLGPGQMLVVDLVRGEFHLDNAIKETLATARPWAAWLERHLQRVEPAPESLTRLEQLEQALSVELGAAQNIFGYSAEEHRFIFEPMAREHQEPVGSMGDDTPLAVLSRQPRLPCTYFKQLFAQVTNPPIDSIREAMVMDTRTMLGAQRDWLEELPEHADKVLLEEPILTLEDLDAIQRSRPDACSTLEMTWSIEGGERGLKPALEALCQLAERAVDDGKTILILSDINIDASSAPIPVLLATGAVHHHLRRVGKRHLASIIAQSGEPREVHHIATLIGYGASAVQPWLAELTIARQVAQAPEEVASLIESWRAVLLKGLRKVMAKMGITVLRGYQGAQLFEAIGLSDDVIDLCFTGTRSGVGGVGFELLAAESLARHARGVTHERPDALDDQGHFRFRRDGELHAWSPAMLRAIKKFRKDADPEQYALYRQANEERDPVTLRDLLTWQPAKHPVDLSEVEPARAIVRRFTTAAMSLGSLSPETHRTLAVAMNRLGAKSNTGEGGEDPSYYIEPDGAEAIAAIKQVASGRFGVTTEYLMQAEELEIKMAQGSKPGEGGQIPGHKVTGLIARLRRSVPGVSLISPPPHHDIYSIEDLAQLIHDLRQVNPRARICVKLVAEAGVGTIAAGVAKAGADTILISGHDGGTGASPLSSIKNAGSPWELGLAETQQALVFNNLRERVLLRTDGGLKTGRDIIIAAMLGAEEYNFGTAALVALGCRYVRQCHSNTCPVGIATQREDLRERYDGDADQLVAFFIAVAEEVREHLALLGVRSLDELIGHAHLLSKRDLPDHPKAQTLELAKLTAPPMPGRQVKSGALPDEPHQPSLNDRIVADCAQALEHRIPVARSYHVRNTDRTIGARISGKIVTRYGLGGLPRATIRLDLDGSAGQSFGAFLVDGVRMRLKGEANDYVGKGMSGGELIIRPMDYHHTDRINILAGNTVLYGATAGELFLAGAAGERFAVRNSGATAIVEGVGAHGCEYMTGGTVMILGPVGLNFAAGMTGGVAYVWDPEGKFESRYHPDFVRIERLESDEDISRVEALIEQHYFMTQSPRAAELLEMRRRAWSNFWKVTPLAATDSVADTDSDDKRDVA